MRKKKNDVIYCVTTDGAMRGGKKKKCCVAPPPQSQPSKLDSVGNNFISSFDCAYNLEGITDEIKSQYPMDALKGFDEDVLEDEEENEEIVLPFIPQRLIYKLDLKQQIEKVCGVCSKKRPHMVLQANPRPPPGQGTRLSSRSYGTPRKRPQS